jgi:hypothetical protein
MALNNPHLLKRHSLFAMFCLSYLPLFLLLIIKVLVANKEFLHFAGFKKEFVLTFFERFGFVLLLVLLSIYAVIGTKLTIRKIYQKKGNAFPVTISSIKPKNEEALSYLASYVIPLLIQGTIGVFEYSTFAVLFLIYYKLYSTSSLILINPILNLKYGLYDIEYSHINGEKKQALVISKQQWLNEEDELKLLKLSHRLYFAF